MLCMLYIQSSACGGGVGMRRRRRRYMHICVTYNRIKYVFSISAQKSLGPWALGPVKNKVFDVIMLKTLLEIMFLYVFICFLQVCITIYYHLLLFIIIVSLIIIYIYIYIYIPFKGIYIYIYIYICMTMSILYPSQQIL